MSINPEAIISAAELLAYRERVVKLRESFASLGRGARHKAAFDLRVSPTRISYVLISRHIDPDLLEKLEAWTEESSQLLAV
jgi:hypothetical protein